MSVDRPAEERFKKVPAVRTAGTTLANSDDPGNIALYQGQDMILLDVEEARQVRKWLDEVLP